ARPRRECLDDKTANAPPRPSVSGRRGWEGVVSRRRPLSHAPIASQRGDDSLLARRAGTDGDCAVAGPRRRRGDRRRDYGGSLRLASDDEERAEILAEYEALHDDGFAADWRDELPHLRPTFRGAIFHPADGALQPARFVRRLAGLAATEGVAFQEHSRIESLDDLDAEQVVIATDGSGRGLLPELDDAVWPARGQVLTTEALGAQPFGG